MSLKPFAKEILFGVAVGDALGVPFEFSTREAMSANPAKEMIGFGTHNQPPGTWSDDSSLTFCLAESIANGYDLEDVAANFIKWKYQSYWTARGFVFDIGITTSRAITRLKNILSSGIAEDLWNLRNNAEEFDNGNGSLMRILPLLYLFRNKSLQKQFDLVWTNSALTHRHIRAAMCCMIYLKLAEKLINGLAKGDAYEAMRVDIKQLWEEINFPNTERRYFESFIQNDIRIAPQKTVRSGGYVIESIEASLWSFLTTNTFKDAVLTAINLGHDTDTSGAITGGIAGLYYGFESIPEYWIVSLARMEAIMDLANRLDRSLMIK